ncbi:hypothetical protein ACJX0J_039574, partial [Zea mays]
SNSVYNIKNTIKLVALFIKNKNPKIMGQILFDLFFGFLGRLGVVWKLFALETLRHVFILRQDVLLHIMLVHKEMGLNHFSILILFAKRYTTIRLWLSQVFLKVQV